MVNEQGDHLPIACRYVPYDQWFSTHIDPTWRIKHLKQRIISKCLMLPFDPRFIRKGVTPNARPPSPITFAPVDIIATVPGDGGDDQLSLGGGGGGGGDEGYEEDDEWEQEFDISGLPSGKISPKVKSKSSSPTAVFPPPFHLRLRQHQQKQEQEPQITTHHYTLFRFSTGQILEEDFQISWYDIQPHELVELHSSFLPPTFASAFVCPMSIPSPPSNIVPLPQSKSTQGKKKPSSSRIPDEGHHPIPSVIALQRHTPDLYIQPHWHGWVRVLKVTQTVPMSDEHSDPSLERPREGGAKSDRIHGEKVEWKERWVVIHDGVVNIRRNLMDPNPTRFPLSSLLALHGPEYLHQVLNAKKPRSKLRTPTSSVTSTITSTTSEDLLKQIERNTPNLKKDGKQQLFSATSSSSLRSLRQDHPPHRTASSASRPTPSNTKLKDDLGFSFTLGGKDKLKGKSKEKEKGGDREKEGRENGDEERGPRLQSHRPSYHKENSDKDKSRSKSLRDNKTFIPTSREEADQAGMKVVCVNYRIQEQWDKPPVRKHGGVRRYTSTGPSLASLAASAPGATTGVQMSVGPHVVIDSDVHVAESPFEDGGSRHQPQVPQGILMSSSTSSLSRRVSNFSRRTTSAASGTDSGTTSPMVYPTWNLFGGNKDKDDKERKTIERRKMADDESTGAAEDVEVVNSFDWKSLPPPKLLNILTKSTEVKVEDDEAEPSHTVAPSSPITTRPTVVIPSATTSTTPAESQPKQITDSSSPISVSSPVFAHSADGSDLDNDTFGSPGGGGSASGGSAKRSRKGYRYGGYHGQVQTKKVKTEEEDEHLSFGEAAEVEGKLGDGGQPQQEEEERYKDEEREDWIALDLVNDNAFSSMLRILHRHSPPSLASSFTHSHNVMNPPQHNKSKSNSPQDPNHGFKDQVVPSDTDDDVRYAAPAKRSTGGIHPPILESLAARAASNHHNRPLYVALPYPEWRLEVVNRARRAGMREMGRPLDLALHGWGREFEEMAAAARERKLQREKALAKGKEKRRKSVQSHVSTIKERGRRLSGKVVDGSDADDDDDTDRDEEEGMGEARLDTDSEEESDTEWTAWVSDLPRQFLQQRSQLAVQTSQSLFTPPSSSSDGPVRLPRTQEEERIFHAEKIRKLEPSAISTVVPGPSYLPSYILFVQTTFNAFLTFVYRIIKLSTWFIKS